MTPSTFSCVRTEVRLWRMCPDAMSVGTHVSRRVPVPTELDALGQEMATLLGSKQQAGYRSAVWDASQLSSGLYFYKLTAHDYSETRTMMLVK